MCTSLTVMGILQQEHVPTNGENNILTMLQYFVCEKPLCFCRLCNHLSHEEKWLFVYSDM